jgi:hypothetical protein
MDIDNHLKSVDKQLYGYRLTPYRSLSKLNQGLNAPIK